MHHVAVCICTFERIAGLRALLHGVERQRLVTLSDDRVVVFVVDNSPSGSASGICSSYATGWRFRLRYVHEPRKGLTFARNTALSAAMEGGTALVAFIDDDEMPEPTWLETLVATITATGAAAAVGPVYPIFESIPPPWLPVDAYTTKQLARSGLVDMGHTGNSILDASVLRSTGLSFNARYNDTGGEDTIFFKQLRSKGLKIAWAENAVAHEVVPRRRMSARWLWLRWFRTGEVEAHLGAADPASMKGRLMSLARGLIRIGGGSLRFLYALLTLPWRKPGSLMWSTYTLCRGAGLIASAIGYRYRAYTTASTTTPASP
jgi:glycosyltransferase involved in cell wall biosynthesis